MLRMFFDDKRDVKCFFLEEEIDDKTREVSQRINTVGLARVSARFLSFASRK